MFVPVVGGGEVGAALLEQPVDGVFFTGSLRDRPTHRRSGRGRAWSSCSSSSAARTRPTSATTSTSKAAAESLADGAFYNTGQSCCSVERIYVHERIHDAFVEAVRGDGAAASRSATRCDEGTYIGPLTRAAQLEVLEAQVADALAQGRDGCSLGGKRHRRARATGSTPTVLDRASTTRWR